MSAKISVIIPVYNDEDYLEQTLRCWTEQTFRDIEIILVNDASTDGTAKIMEAWAQKDGRIKVYTLAQNGSAWVARMTGVEKATGEYIMFCDADDGIVPDACEILYNEMQRDPVDILHFNTEIINVSHFSEEQLSSLKQFLVPYNGSLKGKEILLKCFRDRNYNWALWNKIYSARLCKKALAGREQFRLTHANDLPAYFMIAYFANSYRNLNGKPLYQYYFGRGASGKKDNPIAAFRAIHWISLAATKIRDFLEAEHADPQYFAVEESFRTQQIKLSIDEWQIVLDENHKSAGMDILLDAWPVSEVVTNLASSNAIDRCKLAEQVRNAEHFRYQPRKPRTIATYFYTIANGGTQRVMSALCALWVQMGYRVVLLYERGDSEEEYAFPDGMTRVILPRFTQSEGADYPKRAEILRRCIEENQIDAVVYHAWMLNLALWDEMIIKACGAAFILHCHGVFTTELLRPTVGLKNLTAAPRLADAVVTLSETDRTFWKHFNSNVFQVNNPFTGNFDEWPVSSCGGHNILWLARISEEKRPFDTLAILQSVLQKVPDAMLHIVGSTDNPNYEKRFKNAVRRMNLSEHVVMHGFQYDVMPYFKQASLFLMTSEFEGYPMTLQESMAAGLPTVMYALPHLTLVQDNPGIISVPQGDTHAAAEAICALLLDDARRKQMGKQARKYIEQQMQYDYAGTWRGIFDSLGQPHSFAVSEQDRLMMETLILHHDIGLQRKKDAMRYGGRKTVRTAIKIVKAKDMLHEQGLRYVMKKGAKKLKDYTRDNGLKYTLRKVREKLFG